MKKAIVVGVIGIVVGVVSIGVSAYVTSARRAKNAEELVRSTEQVAANTKALDEQERRAKEREDAKDMIRGAKTLGDAIKLIGPQFSDESDGTISGGAALLTMWAIPNMTWADVGVAKDETSHALVMKRRRNKPCRSAGRDVRPAREQASERQAGLQPRRHAVPHQVRRSSGRAPWPVPGLRRFYGPPTWRVQGLAPADDLASPLR